MKKQMKYDFSGYATKYDVPCSDGRTIKNEAFGHMDGLVVPLVFHHSHDDLSNVIGRVLLEHREGDGIYAHGSFNDTDNGKTASTLVAHKDLTSLSIYANKLKQQVNDVIHGVIKEVGLVLAGANPEAVIDFVSIAHADGAFTTSESEACYFIAEEDAH